jgi:NAD(P)-dependent dehydrogenase (short-subunit alcohol dehydrogenase family)
MEAKNVVVFITGASSGMGREAALELHRRGATVYAAARREMPELAAVGIHTVSLDVTDDASLKSAVDQVLGEAGRIDVLINNAGYGSYGAIEEVPMGEARRQFEVNIFGAMRLTQLVVPGMRERGSGRIVNISSIGGKFSMAFGGWYHATKHALEALSDALRQELTPFGVDVVIIEPGLVNTDWPTIAAQHLRDTSGNGPYGQVARSLASAFEFGGPHLGATASDLGHLIADTSLTDHPRTRYRKGKGATTVVTLAKFLPGRAMDTIILQFLNHADDLVTRLREHLGDSAEAQGL